MDSVFLAALLLATPAPAPAQGPDVAALDQRCFQLMASLAEEEDPRIRSLGRVAAQYFLGRIDAAAPDFDPASAEQGELPGGAERERLLGQCGDAMQAGGRNFRSIGRALAPPPRPSV